MMDAEQIIVELEVATTFCEVGLMTRSITRAKHNVQNVRKALQAVSHLKQQTLATKNERREISRRMSNVESLLVELERRIDCGAW